MKALILAAGKGTRMSPLGDITPKLLMPVYNQPLIHRFVDILKDYVEEIVFVVDNGEFGQKIKDYAQNKIWPVNLSFAIQQEARGTGHALQVGKEYIPKGERFIFMYGDDIYSKIDVANLLRNELGLVGKAVNDPEKWGILHQDAEGYLTKMIEKPKEFVGNLANIGLYLLHTDIFDIYDQVQESPRGEIEATDNITIFCKTHKMKVIAVEGYWLPLGYPWHILGAHEKLIEENQFIIQGIIEPNVTVKGRLRLGRNSLIKSGTYIEGDVIIGDNCIVGPNAFIRGISVIGDNCKIGAFCEVKNSTLFAGTAVSHLAYIGDSILGYNVNISAGTITNVLYPDWKQNKQMIKVNIKGELISSNLEKLGSIIGDNTNIAAGTILYPGVKIRPNINTEPGEVVTRDK